MQLIRKVTVAAALAAVAAAGAPADAQTLPAARDIVARHVTAIGGRDAWLAKKSIRARAALEMPAMGLSGTVEILQSRSGKSLMVISVPGVGEMKQGFDGQVGWAQNPMIGPRIFDGAELAQTRDEARFESGLREAPAITGLQTVESTTLGGEQCYKVRVTWASGRVTHDCYSIASGLLVATLSTQETPMGAIDQTTILSEYRDFGGLKTPTLMRQSALGQETVIRVTAVEYDNAEPTLFDAPPEVVTLIQQRPRTPR